MREVFEIGFRSGDFEYAGYAAHVWTYMELATGAPLGALCDEALSLGDRFDFSPSAAGLSLYARWKKSPKEFASLKDGFISAGIAWQDVSRYFAGEVQAAALFGFSHLDAEKIAAALRKMRAIRG